MTSPSGQPPMQEDITDWWERQRLAARDLCHARAQELHKVANERIDRMEFWDCVTKTSEQRNRLEKDIADMIAQTEGALANDMAREPEIFVTQSGNLTGFTGCTWSDLGMLVTGGGASAGSVIALIGKRAAPAVLGSIGAAAVAAPAVLAVTLVGITFSALCIGDDKRQAYRQAISAMIDRQLTNTADGANSVLSRHRARLDKLHDDLLQE